MGLGSQIVGFDTSLGRRLQNTIVWIRARDSPELRVEHTYARYRYERKRA